MPPVSSYQQKIINLVLDVIFPKICLGCGKFTHSTSTSAVSSVPNGSGQTGKNDFDYVCGKCFREITLKNILECIVCNRETRLGLTCAFCANKNKVDQLIIAVDLSNPLVDKILKTYKYKFVRDMAAPLSIISKKCVKNIMLKGFNLFKDNPLLIPVPLRRKRLNWRGFNQAGLLAKNISDAYCMSYRDDILIRIADPKHQADIKAKEDRINNVRNNFTVKDSESLRGRTVILVDDICTTGATINECARVLKESRAKRVIGFAIARN